MPSPLAMRLKKYNCIPDDVHIGTNSLVDKVEWLIRRLIIFENHGVLMGERIERLEKQILLLQKEKKELKSLTYKLRNSR